MSKPKTTLVPQPMLTTREVASLFGVSKNAVLEWVKNGTVRSVRPSGTGHHRFPESEIRALLERQQE